MPPLASLLACLPCQAGAPAAPQNPELSAAVLLECGGPLRDLVLDGKGGTVFTLAVGGRIIAWQRAAAKEVWRQEQPAAWGLEWTEPALLMAAVKPTVAALDPRTGQSRSIWKGSEDGDVTGFVAEENGLWAWCSTAQGLVHMGPDEKFLWRALDADEGVTVSALAMDEKCATLALGCSDGRVRFAAADNGELDYKKALAGPPCPVTALAYAPKLLIVASQDGSLRLWNPVSGAKKAELSQSGAPARVLAVSVEAGWFASGDKDGNVLLWQLASGVVRGHWKNDRVNTPIVGLAFDPDGKTLLAAAGSRVLALDLAGAK